MAKRNTLKNHVEKYGLNGRYTFHAGYNVNEDISASVVAEAALREVGIGDVLVIRDNQVVVAVKNVMGVFVEVEAVNPKLRKVTNYRACGEGRTGKYNYGKVKINKAHLDLLK